jgi:hypothetical protein
LRHVGQRARRSSSLRWTEDSQGETSVNTIPIQITPRRPPASNTSAPRHGSRTRNTSAVASCANGSQKA